MNAKPEEKSPERRWRKEWRLRDLGGQWLILRTWDVFEAEKVVQRPLSVAVLLRRWLCDSACQPILLDLCRELWGMVELRLDHARRRHILFSRLEEEFRGGRLVLVAPMLDVAVPPGKGAAGSSSSSKSSVEDVVAAAQARQAAIKARDDAARAQKLAAKEKTWVTVRLKDQDGKPVPNERYKIVLPDGSVQEGSLNAKGEVSFFEIDPGQCQITFPDLHEKEWKPS